MVLYVTAPTGEKLAGRTATLTVNASGSASVQTDLIDPFGVVRDSITHQPIDGIKLTLYWADTDLNRSKGRTPGTQVVLPSLPDMAPNQNRNSQLTVDGGKYGWMVFPEGDYYIIAEKDGYKTYDSRHDMRDVKQGDTSYIRNGIIHVGQTVVRMDFTMQSETFAAAGNKPYLSGYPDGTFRPDNRITRAELAAILSRILTYRGDAGTSTPYHDINSSYWALHAIAEMSDLKIMVGSPDGNFYPEQPVTRAELAAVIARLLPLPSAQGTPFTDVDGSWAKDSILKMANAGLVSGYGDGTFRPEQSLTRAEAAVIFNKLMGRSSQSVASTPKWSDVPTDFWAYGDILAASISL
ncbi:S-layer homology domain-containing protein [Aneurinibacillus soli]|nr:S-layer homology domain-containing protein [Aneurinibacillus soli]